MNVSALNMWEENELSNVEFIPEPSDYRIVSAADSATVGHQEGWRGEVQGARAHCETIRGGCGGDGGVVMM